MEWSTRINSTPELEWARWVATILAAIYKGRKTCPTAKPLARGYK